MPPRILASSGHHGVCCCGQPRALLHLPACSLQPVHSFFCNTGCCHLGKQGPLEGCLACIEHRMYAECQSAIACSKNSVLPAAAAAQLMAAAGGNAELINALKVRPPAACGLSKQVHGATVRTAGACLRKATLAAPRGRPSSSSSLLRRVAQASRGHSGGLQLVQWVGCSCCLAGTPLRAAFRRHTAQRPGNQLKHDRGRMCSATAPLAALSPLAGCW